MVDLIDESTGAIELPLIQTKFFGPRLTADILVRERLLSLLDTSFEFPLTMVSSPAGSGKSILVSQWLSKQKHAKIWLSLDESDSDIRQFLTYLIAALNREFPGTCRLTKQLITAPKLPPIATVVSHLLNELIEIEGSCTIVFDDYHLLEKSSLVHEFTEQFLEHPPPQIHLVIITRRDPALPLTRFRALNQMLEIRMQDLRFTKPEIFELLATSTGYSVSDESVAHLQKEIEGWAVGLRLVSLALRRSIEPDKFLLSLHGGIPQIQEYLLSEVLSALPDDLRACVLKTSVLNRFCGDLASFICASGKHGAKLKHLDGHGFIQQLQSENLFVISLDSKDQWFRYHHLFQDLLQDELAKALSAEDIEDIHMNACIWFETRGFIGEAITHALKAGDALFAARVVERHCYQEMELDRYYVIEKWLALIPEEICQQRLKLVLAQARVASYRQELEKVAILTALAIPLLSAKDNHIGLAGELDFLKGYLHFWGGDFEKCIPLLESAQRKIESHENTLKAETDLHLAIVLYMNGQAELAVQMLNRQIRKHGGNQLTRRIGALAFIHMLSADLLGTRAEAWRMRNLDKQMGSPLVESWSYYFEACADLNGMRLEAALENFKVVVSRPHIIDRRAVLDVYAGMALAYQLLGQTDNATETTIGLMAFVSDSADPASLALVSSCQSRIDLLHGNHDHALERASLVIEDPGVFDLFIWLEVPAITRIRVLINVGSSDSLAQARELIDEIRSVSENCRFTNQLIEITVLEVLLLDKQGSHDEAMMSLEQSLDMAEPNGWVRPFVEAGQQMAALLKSIYQQDENREYVATLLEAFQINNSQSETAHQGEVLQSASEVVPALDELTNRELDILELLAQRMQNKEIANKLFISIHTVKDHLKHIYQKLGVSNRRHAVSRAIELNLVSPK